MHHFLYFTLPISIVSTSLPEQTLSDNPLTLTLQVADRGYPADQQIYKYTVVFSRSIQLRLQSIYGDAADANTVAALAAAAADTNNRHCWLFLQLPLLLLTNYSPDKVNASSIPHAAILIQITLADSSCLILEEHGSQFI